MEWTTDYSDFTEGEKTQRFRQSPGKKDKNPQPSLNLRENFSMIVGTIEWMHRRWEARIQLASLSPVASHGLFDSLILLLKPTNGLQNRIAILGDLNPFWQPTRHALVAPPIFRILCPTSLCSRDKSPQKIQMDRIVCPERIAAA